MIILGRFDWLTMPCKTRSCAAVFISGVPIIETSTNQSDVIIRSDDRFLNLVVDSDSIVSKIYMLNFVVWLGFFSVSILTKILQFYPSWCFLPSILINIWQFCPSVLLTTQSIHIFGLVYYLSIFRNSPFYIRCYTYGKRSFVLF